MIHLYLRDSQRLRVFLLNLRLLVVVMTTTASTEKRCLPTVGVPSQKGCVDAASRRLVSQLDDVTFGAGIRAFYMVPPNPVPMGFIVRCMEPSHVAVG